MMPAARQRGLTRKVQFITFQAMNILIIAGGVSLIILICFFFLFALYSLLEKEKRAFWRSSIVFLFLIIISIIFFLAESPLKNWLFGTAFILLILDLGILLLSPLKRKSTEIVGGQNKLMKETLSLLVLNTGKGLRLMRSIMGEDLNTRRQMMK